MAMADESEIKNGPGALARFKRYAHEALWAPLRITSGLILMAIASIEALLAPFLGVRWALFSLATAAVAIGYTLFAALIWLQHIGSRVDQLWKDELEKNGQPPRSTLPVRPFSTFRN